MLPYFEQPAWQLGPLTIHAFGVAVALAFWIGLTATERRLQRTGLDTMTGHRLGGWMIVGGVIGAHLFSVLLYFPHKLQSDPWLLVRVWDDISSFGGMLGGITGAFLFVLLRPQELNWRRSLAYLDAIAFVFPGALAIGRIGCALAHDHVGGVTSFPLGISLESEAARTYLGGAYDLVGLSLPPAAEKMGFHDLGLYEFLFLVLLVVPAFMYWNRQPRPTGFYLIAFSALSFPVRFAFDMLRVADARYLGLTPAQWGSALIMAALPFAAIRHPKLRLVVCGAVILVTACACWGGS